jgi:hypothetical protein
MPSVIEGVDENSTYWYRADTVIRLISKLHKGAKPSSLNESLAGDTFYMFFLPFPQVRASTDSITEEEAFRRWVVAEALSRSQTWKIKANTVADPVLSSVAATIFVASLLSREGRKGSSRDSELSGEKRGDGSIDKALRTTSRAIRSAAALKTIIARTGAGTGSSLMF